MQDNRKPRPVPAADATRPIAPCGPASWSALSWVRDLAFSVLIAVVLIVFIYQPVKVEGTSMMPTLTDQERIFINKFTYHFGLGSIERGDMVVFWFPLDPSKSYIKRVIGVPGDRCEIDAGQVYRQWPAPDRKLRPRGLPRPQSPGHEHRVPPDAVFRAGRSSQFVQRQPHLGLRARARTSTARPSSSTGRSKKWAACDRNSCQRSSSNSVVSSRHLCAAAPETAR